MSFAAVSGLSDSATWKRQRMYFASLMLSRELRSQASLTIFFRVVTRTMRMSEFFEYQTENADTYPR